MAERVEEARGESTPEEASATAGVAAALAGALSRRGRKTAQALQPDPELDAFLAAHTRLAGLQAEHLHEQRELVLSRLRWGRVGDRLRALLQAATVAVGFAVVALITLMAWRAHEDHGLVVDAFSAPPQLAQDGLSGQVVAARFLDKLQALQAATRSERPASSYQNNWGSELKVEIPQTGLTFGDFERLLREKLGHETHVTGEVIRTPTGIALTARFGEAGPATFVGPEADIDKLAQQAAEAIYRAIQPYRYAQYLDGLGRVQEAIAVDTDLAANGPASERAWAYSSLVLFDVERGDLAAAQRDVDAGLAAGGDGVAFVNIAAESATAWTGHDETLLGLARLIDRQVARQRLSEVSDAVREENLLIDSAYLAGQTGAYARAATDYATLARSARPSAASALFPGQAFYAGQAAWADAMNHDIARARAELAKAGPLDLDFYTTAAIAGFYAQPNYQLAASSGDWTAALAAIRQTDALIETHRAERPSLGLMRPNLIHPLEARALLRSGDVAGARALIATTTLDCYLCVRVRAEVAEASGDRAGAERWWADAVRQAPRIPFAFMERGEAKLARGDLAGAIADFQAAHRLEPRFADPLKAWGDALARRGQWGEALAKYDTALADAPAWRELSRARDEAAHRPPKDR